MVGPDLTIQAVMRAGDAVPLRAAGLGGRGGKNGVDLKRVCTRERGAGTRGGAVLQTSVVAMTGACVLRARHVQ
jgi:hypothetical protein